MNRLSMVANLGRAGLGIICVLAAGTAVAQNNFNLEALNPGEIMMNLNANEQVQVEQDTLHASLYYAAQGRDRVALQDEVNSKMAEAQGVLTESDVESSIQQYRVHQLQPNRAIRGDAESPVWRAQQSLQLISQDSAAVLDLVAELQGIGLTMGGMNYSLSNARQEEAADSLMADALAKVSARADAAAAALGKSGVEIVELTMNSGSNGGFYRASAMSTASAMEVATPVAEPGMSTVTFNVSARAILLP